MEYKFCIKCELTLLPSFFQKERNVCNNCRYSVKKQLKNIRKTENILIHTLIEEKQCITCLKTKSIVDFNKLVTNKDGYCSYCRECFKTSRRNNKIKTCNKISPLTKVCNTCLQEKTIIDFKKTNKSVDGYFHKCSTCWKPREWNKEKQKISEKKYIENNKDKIKAKWKKDGQQINRRIRDSLNKRIKYAFSASSLRKELSTLKYIGCSLSNLKKWFEYQFSDTMNWNNYGDWHIDHTKPCSAFDLSIEQHVYECFNWTNLRPCWKQENLQKSDAIIPDLIAKQKQLVNTFLSNPLPSQPGNRVDGTE